MLLSRIIVAAVLLPAANAPVNAQTFEWAKTGSGGGVEYGKSIAVDKAGSCYVTGFFSDTAWFGTEMVVSAGGEDIFIAKYNNDGSLAWLKRGGHQQHDNGTAITVDKNNNVFVTGIYDVFCVLDSFVVFGGTMFTAKLDTAGNVLWLKSAQADRPWGISADTSGNCYITGDYYTRAYFDNDTLFGIGKADIFCVNYSKSGDVLWSVRAGGRENDYGYSIATDPSGNSFITGYIRDTVVADNDTLISNGGSDIFIAKLDSAGNFLWQKNVGGAGDDIGFGIAWNGDQQSAALAGSFSDTINIGAGQLTASGSTDIFVAVCDSSGNFNWVRQAGGKGNDAAYSVDCSNSGEIYITGTVSDTAYFQSTEIRGPIPAAKYSPSGNLLWVKEAGGVPGDEGRDIAAGANGDIFITGNIVSDSAIFGTLLLSAQSQDVFCVKLNEMITKAEELTPAGRFGKIEIYPNPAHETITVLLNESGFKGIYIRIFNTIGEVVTEKYLEGAKIFSLSLNQLPEGIYFLSVNDITRRIVVSH